ncbi:hypothetical protein BN136_1702 [Cronobacter universalis NCTC 9529]|nr:hypothetical protein BN136_1702 [Cronobacter universalis NCTC 9529]
MSGSTVSTGWSKLTVKRVSLVVVLPARSVMLTLSTYCWPSCNARRSVDGMAACQLPSAPTVAVYVFPFSVTVTVCPSSAMPVEPRRIWVVPACSPLSTSPVNGTSCKAGATVSTLISAVWFTVLPLTSTSVTVMVLSPCGRACSALAGSVTLQLPSAPITPVKVLPFSVTVMVRPALAASTTPVSTWFCNTSLLFNRLSSVSGSSAISAGSGVSPPPLSPPPLSPPPLSPPPLSPPPPLLLSSLLPLSLLLLAAIATPEMAPIAAMPPSACSVVSPSAPTSAPSDASVSVGVIASATAGPGSEANGNSA